MSDQAMFNAISQSQQDFSNKQASMQNMYTTEVDMFNQKKQQIQKYNTDMKSAARGQLNNLIGSDFAEAGIYGIQAGKQLYGQYKTARQAREGTAGAAPSEPGYKIGVGGDVKLAPAAEKFDVYGEAPAPAAASTVTASGSSAPSMVSSGAQTDTPQMKLKGGMDESKLVYDPSQPGMIKMRDESTPGGFRVFSSGQDELKRQLDKQQADLQETSITPRAARQRALVKQGADPDDIDLPRPGEAPPRVTFGTDGPIREVDFSQQVKETAQEATVRQQREFFDRVQSNQGVDKRGRSAFNPSVDEEIPISRTRTASLAAKMEESGGVTIGFDPRSGGVRPRSKTVGSATDAPVEPTNIEDFQAAIPEPASFTSIVPPTAAPIPQAAQAKIAQPPQASQPPAQPSTQPQGKVEGNVQEEEPEEPKAPDAPDAPAPTPKDTPPAPTEDPAVKPPVGDDVPKEGGGGGFGDALGLAGLGYGIYEEAESSDSTTDKALNITGQVGAFAGIEAAEMLVPGAGPVLGALTAIGYGLYDIFSKKHQEEANPTAVKVPSMPVAPTMAFDSTPTLDSSSFRQPLGGIVQ